MKGSNTILSYAFGVFAVCLLLVFILSGCNDDLKNENAQRKNENAQLKAELQNTQMALESEKSNIMALLIALAFVAVTGSTLLVVGYRKSISDRLGKLNNVTDKERLDKNERIRKNFDGELQKDVEVRMKKLTKEQFAELCEKVGLDRVRTKFSAEGVDPKSETVETPVPTADELKRAKKTPPPVCSPTSDHSDKT